MTAIWMTVHLTCHCQKNWRLEVQTKMAPQGDAHCLKKHQRQNFALLSTTFSHKTPRSLKLHPNHYCINKKAFNSVKKWQMYPQNSQLVVTRGPDVTLARFYEILSWVRLRGFRFGWSFSDFPRKNTCFARMTAILLVSFQDSLQKYRFRMP